MKKTLRTILAGAVALLAVSCYDDSNLREEISGVKDRLDAIEATLNAEVNGINDLASRLATLEGKVAAIKVETKDGVTTLTLSNDMSVVLSKDGVLTIDNGRWATVAPDGTVTPLAAKLGDAIDFKVENGELKVSYDGTNYEATGVKVSEYTAHVIGNVVPAADGKSVAVTIGDQTLTLPLVSSAVATLGLSRESFFLRYSATKEVEITATNLTELYVMNEPDGWDASIEGNILTIASPSVKAVNADAADAKGLVLVHATDEEGKCVVAKLEVSTGLGLSVEVDNKGMLTIKNAYATYDPDYRETIFDDFIIGIVPSEYFENPDAYLSQFTMDTEPEHGVYGNMYYNWKYEFAPYEEVTYEVDEIKISVADVNAWLNYDNPELEYGKKLSIWVAPSDPDNFGFPKASEVQFVEYTHMLYEVSATATHNDIILEMQIAGATGFFLGYQNAYWEEYGTNFEKVMNEGTSWMYLTMGMDPNYSSSEINVPSGVYSVETNTQISLAQLFGKPLAFGSKHYVWVFPYFEGTIYKDFETQFMPYVLTVNTANPELGEVAAPTITSTSDYDSVTATIVPADGTSVYYAWVDPTDFVGIQEDPAAVFELVTTDCDSPLTYEESVTNINMSSGETVTLAVVSISQEGKYSVSSTTLTSKVLPSTVDETIALTLGDAASDYSSISVPLDFTTGVTAYYKYYSETNYALLGAEELVEDVLLKGKALVSSGNVTVSNLSPGTKQVLAVVAVSEDGASYRLLKDNIYSSKPYPYSADVQISYVAGSMVYNEDAGTVAAKFNVTGADKVVVKCYYDGYEVSLLENWLIGGNTTITYCNVVDGVVEVEVSGAYQDTMILFATAYNVDADNNIVSMAQNGLALKISENIQ